MSFKDVTQTIKDGNYINAVAERLSVWRGVQPFRIFGSNEWFSESVLQSLLYERLFDMVKNDSQHWFITTEQRWLKDRYDIFLAHVEDDALKRIGIEVKADFDLESAIDDATKLFSLVNSEIQAAFVFFAVAPNNLDAWETKINSSTSGVVKAIGVPVAIW